MDIFSFESIMDNDKIIYSEYYDKLLKRQLDILPTVEKLTLEVDKLRKENKELKAKLEEATHEYN